MSISVPFAVTMMIGTVESRPDRPADVDPRQLREHDVEQDEVRLDLFELRQCLGPVAGDGDLESLACETDDQSVDEGLLVLCKKHRHRRAVVARCVTGALVDLHSSLWAGSVSRKVDPSPSRDSTSTLPWWLAATCRTIDRPRPVPPVWRLRPWSTR